MKLTPIYHSLKKRFSSAKTIPGTCGNHCFVPLYKTPFKIYRISTVKDMLVFESSQHVLPLFSIEDLKISQY